MKEAGFAGILRCADARAYRTVAEGTMKNQPRVDPQQQQMTLLRQLVAQSKTE